ncbi:conserved hypothetical protein [Desulfosudis oleivorans Hxd3]|uniref:DUF1573 domain-containing protein n=1 Tax=Desulfosudis oleivorans (strain DSM 6200 / JCM 39069 / Hxd3) TaxID=96561 RepID=A8ZRR5_DESOH|nr:conserved hypothetical protein [Desulfosudis oleivorans Hxd3]
MASFTRSIPAGGEGTISIKVYTKHYGDQRITKTASVYTNDPSNKIIPLTITGQVERVVSVMPNQVRLSGTVGMELKQVVRIVPGEKYPFAITEVRANQGKEIAFDLKEITHDGRPAYQLTVTNTRKEPGTYIDFIYLKTDSQLVPNLKVRVQGTLVSPVLPNQEPVL